MKKLLPILLCYILMTSQVFALSGGPVFGSGSINPVGTYSGVLVGVPAAGNVAQSTALGLFSISVPTTSVATGAFLLFADGDIFTGNVDASIDIDSNQFAGVAFGYEFEQQNSGTGGTVAVEIAYAGGRILGQVGGAGKKASSSARITGTAFLAVTRLDAIPDDSGKRASTALDCTVSGFRQSTTASTVSSLPTLTNTGG